MMTNCLTRAREPISWLTHFCGAIVSVVGLVFLLGKGLTAGRISIAGIASSLLFGCSLIALYTASSVYHYSNADGEKVLRLRKLDHSMIFVLIAGTYTPILLRYLPLPRAVPFTVFIWLFAAVGITVKLCWFGAPRWLQTVLYLVMGWAILIDPAVFSRMSPGALALLAAGGVCYTIGGLMYMFKKPNLSPRFGFHELFHVFVLAGSLFHFLLVYCCVL